MLACAHEAPADGDKKPCRRCQQTLVFLGRYPVLDSKARVSHTTNQSTTRVRYEGVWICTNPACNRREFVEVREVPDPLSPSGRLDVHS